MEKLMVILSDIRPDLEFEKETRLIDDGILDSFDIISILSGIHEVFGIDINAGDLTAEHFNSAQAIWALINE